MYASLYLVRHTKRETIKMTKKDIDTIINKLTGLGYTYYLGTYTKGDIDITVCRDMMHEQAHPQNKGKGWYLIYRNNDHTSPKVIDVLGAINPYFMTMHSLEFALDYLKAVL